MSVSTPPPDLQAVVEGLLGWSAEFVVVGGFAVIGNRHVRATKDVDLMIPERRANDEQCVFALRGLSAVRARDEEPIAIEMLEGQSHLRLLTDAGLVDLIREGDPPLDFTSLVADAHAADFGTGRFAVAGLASLVGLKRIAGRPIDQQDLIALEAEHGELPMLSIPGLDE